MIDEFGDRMKMYEAATSIKLMPLLPICIRIDGRSFSKWTRDLKRPFDDRLVALMQNTTLFLVKETGAVFGYTQSDEITLILYSDDIRSETFFNGKLQKLSSVIASMTTAYFCTHLGERSLHEKIGTMPMFDCRAWNVPNLVEGANVILWRSQDATKNSIQSSARTVFSHKELHGKSTRQMQEMMLDRGLLDWESYPDYFKYGSFFQRRKEKRRLTPGELSQLPEQHHARRNPDMEFERSVTRYLSIRSPFGKVENRVGVVFRGEDPREI